MIRHAIVGAGYGATVHLPAFLQLDSVEVVALCDSGSGRAEQVAPIGISTYGNWQALLEQEDLDSVSIATPPLLQQKIVTAALQRGLHVFCEKPVGVSVQAVTEMCSLASQAGVVDAVGFQYRYEPGLVKLKKLLDEGRLGAIRRLDVTWLTAGRADPDRPWSWQHDLNQGGGVALAFVTHVLDLVHWLTGRSITSITGRSSVLVPERRDTSNNDRPVTAEDSVDALVELEDVAASLHVSNCQHGGPGMRVEAYGEHGGIVFHHRWPFRSEDASLVFLGAQSSEFVLNSGGNNTMDSRVGPATKLVAEYCTAIKQRERSSKLPSFADAQHVHSALQAMRNSAPIPLD